MSATLLPGIKSLVLNISAPLEADMITPRDDLIGVKVWASTSGPEFVPDASTLVFDGAGLSISIFDLIPNTLYYVKYALISDIEPENYIVSQALSATPITVEEVIDLTPPPTPTGVVFTPAISSIFIEHDTPTYATGGGHSRSVLFGVQHVQGTPLPTFEESVSLAEFTGSRYSYSTNPATTWRLWLVWVSMAGIASTVPFGGTNGIEVKTGEDVTNLLEALNGQITSSQLYTDLNARIDLIDGPPTLSGSVKQQISTLQSAVATRGAGAALNADPNFSSSLAWEVFSGSAPEFANLPDGAVGMTCIRSIAPGVMSWVNEKARIPVDHAKTYRARGKLRTIHGYGSTAYLGVALFDSYGQNLSGDGSQWYYFASNTTPGDQWIEHSGEFGAGTSKPFPSWAKTMTPLVILSYGGGTAMHEAQDLRIEDLTDVKLLTASIQTEATTRATQTGELYAKYGIKLDVNGYVTGWAMNNNGSTGDMIVLADKFAVGAPGGGNIIPFTVNTTTQTINGVHVPAGTYMDAAYIKNGTITNAKIGNAAIDDAKIANLSASKITAGSIAVGQWIASANYISGAQGWAIWGEGNAELNNVTVRGTVYASDGIFSGSLNAATGTFAGSLNAATGTFAGSLTANAVDAVNTVNIAGQAVTIPIGAYLPSYKQLFKNNPGEEIISASIVSSGAKILVQFSAEFMGSSWFQYGVAQLSMSFFIARVATDGTVLSSIAIITVMNEENSSSASQNSITKRAGGSYSFIDQPGPGTAIYSVRATVTGQGSENGTNYVAYRALSLLEVKK